MAGAVPTITAGLLDQAVTSNTNLLQPTGFKVSISRKKFPNVEFFATGVMHPAMGLNAVETSFRRIQSIPFAGDKITFGELTVDVLLDEDLTSYIEIYNWMNYIVQNEEIVYSKRSEEVTPTYADIKLSILSSHNNVNKVITYRDCIPTLLGDINLLSTTGDVAAINCPISFRFSSFEIA